MNQSRSLKINPWREISVLTIILMDVCWVTPWFRSLTTATYGVGSVRVFLVLASVVLLTYILVRLMDYMHLKKTVRQAIMVVFILAGILVGIKTLLYAHQFTTFTDLFTQPIQSFADFTSLIPAEFIVILTILVAFWRGLSVAQAHIGPSSVMDHFWLGIIMYVLFIFINTLVTGETPGDFFYLFLFCALVAMCTSRMTIIGMLRGGTENKFNRFWLVGIILAATLVVLLSALAGGLFGDQFGWVGNLLFAAFGSIIVLVWLVISPLVSFLITILGNFFNSQTIQGLGDTMDSLNQLMQGFGKDITDLLKNSAIAQFLARVGPTLRIVIFIAVIVLVIAGILAWLTIQLWQDRARRRLGGEQKSNLQAENIFQRFLDMIRQGWGGVIDSFIELTDLNRRRRLRAAARIRQVYADLMELCENLGDPREEAATPLEFLPELDQLFPDLHLEAVLITQAYNNVRYGQLPETRQEVEQIELAWKKLSETGKELASEQKHAKKNKGMPLKS